LAMIVLAISQAACVMSAMQVPTVTPTPPASPTATAYPVPSSTATEAAQVQTVTIQAVVYVRQMPDASSAAIGSLETGERVEIVACDGDWCEIVPAGYVFRGCTSDNPDELKCEAK
jgi:uncharacterized protein YgiM (DUF1202 family)